MHGDCSRSAVWVFEKNMTATCPVNSEAGILEGADNLSSLGTGKPRHTEIC